jgi:heme oxygenase
VAVIDRLRIAVSPVHRALEGTALARAMAAGDVSPAAYATLARQTWHLHADVEPQLARAARAWPALEELVDPSHDRAALLATDLRYLAPDDATPAHPAIIEACARVRVDVEMRPWTAAGPLYVLEGSRLGSAVLLRALAAGWGVPATAGVGLDYHLPPSAGWWASTVRSLEALPLNASQVDDICASASALMHSLWCLYQDLKPADVDAASALRASHAS